MESTTGLHTPLMRVDALDFSYAGRPIFQGWSGGFGPGVTWLRGSNGTGKSTLLKLLAGALMPQRGVVVVNGIRSDEQPLDYRREVFWCGPGPVPFDHLSPDAYFGFMRGLYPGADRNALDEHVDGFALRPHLGKPLRTLSTGTQRKVWLVAALAAGTAVTLLDEPMNALDTASLAHMRATLERCALDARRAWIVASHESLDHLSGRIGVLELSANGPS